MTSYVPQKGDFIAVSFDPQSGHEQKGRRPALVVSNDLFNRHTGLAIVCPITTTHRNFPFHVALAREKNVTGFVMVEQVKSVAFRNVMPGASGKHLTSCYSRCFPYWTR